MVRISNEEIEAVRAQADIVDVIGHYLQIHRKGRSYVALCPFHDDHSPSMSISEDRQIFKCFVCGKGGNVFTFVQDYEKISFPEAVGRVASLVGYTLSVQPEAVQKNRDPGREKIYEVLNETIRYTMYELNGSGGVSEKEYLRKRGLDDKAIETFQIGFNPLNDSLYRFMHAKGFADRDLVNANVTRISDSGMHDVFGGRITFPIHDSYGNPIGFSARAVRTEGTSKYINTNDTEVFRKGDIVYNSHRARGPARRAGKVYICEGVTDVIAFWQAGMENAVCTLGTSCTNAQISVLKGMAAKIVFCYDGDEAGQAATWRGAKMAIDQGCTVTIVLNRTGQDPDEILRSRGKEALVEMASHEMSWMEFVLEYLRNRTNMDSYLAKKEMADRAMAEIAKLQDETEKRYFTEQLSQMTGFRMEYVPAPAAKPVQEVLHRIKAPDGTVKAEELILAMMMSSASAARNFEENLGYLIDDTRQTAAMMIIDAMHTYGKADPARLISNTDDPAVRDMISSIAASDEYGAPYDADRMNGAIRRIKRTVLASEADAYREQLSAALNNESRELILNKYEQCLRELRRYIDEDDSE